MKKKNQKKTLSGVRLDRLPEDIRDSSEEMKNISETGKQHSVRKTVGHEELLSASEKLKSFKKSKTALEERIVEDEQWWKLRHWDVLRRGNESGITPASAWLFNSLINKHADIMDSFPEPVCLPREEDDRETAETISSILPVILSQNSFEKTYSDNSWYKLKHGVCAYGAFWNPMKENGIGDIDIKRIDILNIFWQPGITDIQASSDLFLVDLVDEEALFRSYPSLKKQLINTNDRIIELGKYIYDDSISTDDKKLVVDWYYKKNQNGRQVLHYAKFVGDVLLYSSENDVLMTNGWYGHGKYPIVFDVLYPEEGTPYGFGVIAVTKEPQTYIDRMDKNIIENMDWATRIRYFGKKSMGINENDFLDLDKRIVEVDGDISDERLRQITVSPLPEVYLTLKKQKIEELKETSANRDFSQGGVMGGVTAASAIAALQEAGNKNSRDMISASNRAFVELSELIIELMREFYSEKRNFRITDSITGGYKFVGFSNKNIIDKPGYILPNGEYMYRRPIFDVDIKARKRNPYSRLSQNELAKELFSMGVFDDGNERKALALLEIMDFDGIEKMREQLRERLNAGDYGLNDALMIPKY